MLSRLFESPVCGNNFVEPGEQCDCGLKENCKNPCCNPETCMLFANATCATGKCCDLNVSFGRKTVVNHVMAYLRRTGFFFFRLAVRGLRALNVERHRTNVIYPNTATATPNTARTTFTKSTDLPVTIQM